MRLFLRSQLNKHEFFGKMEPSQPKRVRGKNRRKKSTMNYSSVNNSSGNSYFFFHRLELENNPCCCLFFGGLRLTWLCLFAICLLFAAPRASFVLVPYGTLCSGCLLPATRICLSSCTQFVSLSLIPFVSNIYT